MSDAAAAPIVTSAQGGGSHFLLARIAWRNLWRNRRRTYLTSGGIAFAVLLINFAIGMQGGSYAQMISTATALFVGHAQIQTAEFIDKNRLENTLTDPEALMAAVDAVPEVVASTSRAETFALVSVGERSFGALVVGVDAEREARVSDIMKTIVEGRVFEDDSGAVLGTVLARNLAAGIGDEVVVLGSAKEGGVAALAFTITGLFQTGQVDMDRGMLLAPLTAVQEGFCLDDEAHTIVVRAESLDDVEGAVDGIRSTLPAAGAGETVVRAWFDIVPEVLQMIEVDRLGGWFMYWFLMGLVSFSIVNTFIMTVFERTREFGVLLAIGMRGRQILAMLLFEAGYLWLVGALVGAAIATAVTVWLADVGIPLGDLQELGKQMYMPERLYADLTLRGVFTAPAVLFVGAMIAAFVPGVRLLWMDPVAALRHT